MRKSILAAAALALGAAGAMAGGGDVAVSPGQVSAVVTTDWNGDGGFDRAVLVERPEAADLYIYLSNGHEHDAGMSLAVARPGLLWRGAMWGMQPELGLNAAGSLLVHTMNEGIGRHRWRETLTIAYRDGQFLVAGFTFSSYDTLDPGLTRECDANFLSGKGVLDGNGFKVYTRAVPLADWRPELVPPECAAG